ncbi:MAG: class I SAM-dependent methyltransferase [Pyrinomonadaceae bacterium]
MNDGALRNCPGCDSSRSSPAGSKNGFDILTCKDCDSLYTSRLPAEGEKLDYDGYYSESNLRVPSFINERLNEIIGGFEVDRQTNNLLDIGFGAGSILEVASGRGWQVYGQEVSASAVAQARAKGFEVFCGEIADADYADGFFDVVTCSEILEHLPYPQDVLDAIARILRPGGLLWATTPSAKGISYRLMGTGWSVLAPPEHTQLYSKFGIAKMLENAGFSEITIRAFGMNPAEIRDFYRRKGKQDGPSGFDRVQTGYELNEKLSRSRPRQMIKSLLNNSLNLFGVGDSLKIFARK